MESARTHLTSCADRGANSAQQGAPQERNTEHANEQRRGRAEGRRGQKQSAEQTRNREGALW